MIEGIVPSEILGRVYSRPDRGGSLEGERPSRRRERDRRRFGSFQPTSGGPYPVGSGDAFLAGLAVALIDGETLVEAARRGLLPGSPTP